MNRRTFLNAVAATPALGLLRPGDAAADLSTEARGAKVELPKAKITRVRIYQPPNLNPLFNQSNMVVTVETDIGITGIGEGGAKDTLEQCAGTLIGKNPFKIEAIWQEMYIAWFYPPGREKTHALGALDLALWDIKGKALGLPVHELLGGIGARLLRVLRHRRRHAGRNGRPARSSSLKERARATMEAGYRAFRMAPADVPIGGVYNTRSVGAPGWSRTARKCAKASGPNGNWCIDFHQRFDFNDALRACKAIEAVRAVLRRRPGPRRARAAGSPQAAPDDRRCR